MPNPAAILCRALAWRCLLAAMAGLIAPKCFLCLAGYTALAASLGWAGPELCGTNSGASLPLWLSVALALGAGWVGLRLARKISG